MPHSLGTLRLLALTCGLSGLLAVSVSADAAAPQRTFIHSDPIGNDANPCSLASPCRTFGRAIGVVNAGGEVVILDTAGYGPFTINKSVKIIGPSGVYGGISVQGGAGATTGIVINAGPSDDITLRGLDISGVPTVAPLPNIGIDIQSAGTVHIEKSSIGNFTQPAGACINVAPTAQMFVYVDDSFLRECRTGINANGTAVSPPADGPAVIVDNTRIERGRATFGPTWGLWVHGNIGATLRNSLISLEEVGIQVDNLPTNGNTVLELSQAKLVGMGTCLNVASSSAGGVPLVYIDGSQFLGCDDGIVFSHTAAGTGAQLKITDSKFENLNNGGITLSSGADAGINMDLIRSQVNFSGNTALSATSSGTSGVNLHVRDSTLSNTLTLLKTSGTSSITATLIRAHLHNSVTAVDHGRGKIRMEQTTIVANNYSLVNHGSSIVVSAGNNWIVDNADPADGTVYIPTPLPIVPLL